MGERKNPRLSKTTKRFDRAILTLAEVMLGMDFFFGGEVGAVIKSPDVT